jgi:hypothetical protein
MDQALFLSSTALMPCVGAIQLPIKWISRVLSPGQSGREMKLNYIYMMSYYFNLCILMQVLLEPLFSQRRTQDCHGRTFRIGEKKISMT